MFDPTSTEALRQVASCILLYQAKHLGQPITAAEIDRVLPAAADVLGFNWTNDRDRHIHLARAELVRCLIPPLET